MPKMKSHKASKMRMRLTVNGKLMRTKSNVRHMMTNRSPKRKRGFRQKQISTTAGYLRRARYAFLCGQA
jgi:ribosomal protein L35